MTRAATRPCGEPVSREEFAALCDAVAELRIVVDTLSRRRPRRGARHEHDRALIGAIADTVGTTSFSASTLLVCARRSRPVLRAALDEAWCDSARGLGKTLARLEGVPVRHGLLTVTVLRDGVDARGWRWRIEAVSL
jgi:hypothetical protein